jgi:hypothetical protein
LQEPQPDKQQQKQQPGKQFQRQPYTLHGLFAQQEAQEQQQQLHGMVVTPASSTQAALPDGALSDPNEALNPTASRRSSRRGRPGGSSRPLEQQQQPDPQLQQLMTQFQPFVQALQKIARQQQQQQQQQASRRSQQQGTSFEKQQQQKAAAEAEAQWRSSSSSSSSAGLPGDGSTGLQQQREQHIKAPGRTSRLLELFGVQEQVEAGAGAAEGSAAVPGMSALRISQDAADALSAQPSQAKSAAQRLAQMLMQQQQHQARKKHQQPPQDDADNTAAAEQAAEAAADAATPAQLLPSAVPAAGTTRIYLPAPPLAEASSAADRQPLRLLSIRQQEQLRKEARAEAIRKV